MTIKDKIAGWVIRHEILKASGLKGKEKKMLGNLLKNWKTTLLGFLAGITGGTAEGWTNPDGSINWVAVLLAVLIAGLGAMAKDRNVTGGTVPATLEAEKRATGLDATPSSK